MKLFYRYLSIVVAVSALAACALLPGRGELAVNTVQDSEYCGTKTPDADIHYFSSPDPLAAWIEQREIREFRAGVASLTGVFVVELGQRPSAGYSFELTDGASRIEDKTLILAMHWSAPEPDDHVAQVIVSPCVVIPKPQGEYDKVVLIDQLGERRGELMLK